MMFNWFKDHRISLAVVAGFIPPLHFSLMPLWKSGEAWNMQGGDPGKLFYVAANFIKSFLPVSIQTNPANWVHPYHPHVEYVWPVFNNGDESPQAVWGSVRTHTIWGTYAPILMGIAIHKIADHTGLNEKLEEAGFPFDI
jgi:hypothetical protein